MEKLTESLQSLEPPNLIATTVLVRPGILIVAADRCHARHMYIHLQPDIVQKL